MNHSEWDLPTFQIVKKRIQAFKSAFRGWLFFFHEPHAFIHLIEAGIVIGLAACLGVNQTEWMILLQCIGAMHWSNALEQCLAQKC